MSKTALIAAVQRLDSEAASRLLDAKPALLNVIDQQGRNLLHIACCLWPRKVGVPEAVQVEVVDLLLARGFDIDLPYGKDACPALFLAVARARNLPLVKLMIRRGAKIEIAPGDELYAASWW